MKKLGKNKLKHIFCMIMALLLMFGTFFNVAYAVETDVVSDTGCSHTWSTTMKVKKAATCQEEGIRAYYCTKCGAFDDSRTETIKKSDHKWEFDGNKISDCKTANSSIIEKCVNEGCTETRHVKITGHAYLYGTTTHTVTEPGKTTVTCKYCTYHDEVSGHIPDLTEATCTQDKKCVICGTVLEKAKGHSIGEEEFIGRPATLFESGVIYKVCQSCGEVVFEYNYDLTPFQKIIRLFISFFTYIFSFFNNIG